MPIHAPPSNQAERSAATGTGTSQRKKTPQAKVLEDRRPAQFKALPNNSANKPPPLQRQAVVQRAEGDAFGAVSDAILEHMDGEWNGNAGTAVKGGHWLPGMKTTWSANVKLDGQDKAGAGGAHADGLYFSALPKSSGALPGFTTGARPSWYIRKNGVKSGTKDQSSFWPPNWQTSDFKTHLKNSVQTANAHVWQTTDYKPITIVWDSTSSGGSAYPVDTKAPPKKKK